MWNFLARNIRLSVTLILLAASLLFLTIFFPYRKNESLLYTIGLSVSSAGISTTLVQIIFLLTEMFERFTIQKRFLKVFGYRKNSITDGAIAIVIPAFNVGYSPSNQPRNMLKQYAKRILSSSSTKAAKAGIKNDVTAASHIILAFSQLGLPIPQIRWDEEETLNDDKIKTYILIGLSNELLDLIQNPGDKYFRVIPTSDENDNLTKISIYLGLFRGDGPLSEQGRHPDTVNLNPDTSEPKNGIDIGLFAKFKMENDKIFVICGAGTETGTHNIAKYISGSGWDQVYAELKKEKGTSITPTEGFALTYDIPTLRQGSEGISIIRKWIRRNT